MKKPIICEGSASYNTIQVIGSRKAGNTPCLRFQTGEEENYSYSFAYLEDPKKLRRLAKAILEALEGER